MQLQLRRNENKLLNRDVQAGQQCSRSCSFDSRHRAHIYIHFSTLDSTFASYLFNSFLSFLKYYYYLNYSRTVEALALICIRFHKRLLEEHSTVGSIMIYKQERYLTMLNEAEKKKKFRKQKLWSMEARILLKLIQREGIM